MSDKARALRQTSALSRYNARSIHHQCERAQFTIHFIKEIIATTYDFIAIFYAICKCKKLYACSEVKLLLEVTVFRDLHLKLR